MPQAIVTSIILTAFVTTLALFTLDDPQSGIKTDVHDSDSASRSINPSPASEAIVAIDGADDGLSNSPTPELSSAHIQTPEQLKLSLEARWKAERIEADRRLALSRETILREMQRDQEAKREAMIERNKPRPVNVFTGPSVLID